MTVIGHQKIRGRLSRSVEKNTFIQTYLFIGPESVGKFEVAKEFALNLIGGVDSTEKQDMRQEIDLLVLEPERETEKGIVKEKDISVERAREAMRWVENFPYAACRKVLIIRDAQRLTEASQNALLKMLEEPPPHAIIILVTHELGRMLPTTLSRCQQVHFHLISAEEMVTYFSSASLSSNATFLLELGRPGLVMQSIQNEAEFEDCLEILEKLMHLSEKPLRERLVLSESCATHVSQTLRLMMWWMGGLHIRAVASFSNDDSGIAHVRSIGKIEKLYGDLKRFPSSARLTLDAFFLYW